MSTATGGTFIRFRRGTARTSAAHVRYITRERAVLDRDDGVLLHHMPERVYEAPDYDSLRVHLEAHAADREEDEIARHRSGGEPRTHYRVVASFERDVDSDKALAMMREWMDKELPQARGFAVVHRDTEHTHIHVWIDARGRDGKKLHFSRDQHRGLDSGWNQIYSREMGRDAQEHERKKAQTRTAKREGWERKQKPEYPPRTRSTAEELAPKWERREVGVQGAREPRQGPESFLERVRQQARQDFREARSWGELDRRLERHGLRVEARGAGLVVTDGRQVVKASSVDREASRGKLEQRFGETLRTHRARAPELERAATAVREAVGGLREIERREWRRADHARAVEAASAARARADALVWQQERAQRAKEAFGRALGEVYRDPERAREAFTKAAREHGGEVAARQMREQPERFGELRTEERRRMLGLVRTQDDVPARQRAAHAAALGREAAASPAPHPWALTHAQAVARHAEGRVQRMGRAQDADLSRARARVGLAVQRMLPQEAAELARWTTAPQQQLAAKLRQQVERLAPQQMRELAEWVRAPHLALPKSAVQALKGLMQDRGVERER